MEKKNLKVALVHDFLVNFGGAERVLEVMSEMYPEAPIYTLLYDQEGMHGHFKNKDIRASFLQKFPKFLRKKPKWLLPFLPTAPETIDLRDFDLVISSSGAWSKGIITRLNTIHISYLHSPMRFVWDMNEEYLKEKESSNSIKIFSRFFLNYLRIWDKVAADRPDYLIANSKYTQERIKKYYGKESVVIYPPCVDFEFPISNFDSNNNFENSNLEIDSKFDPPTGEQNSKSFLVVSRLSPYKKIDAVVEAFNKLGLPLIIIGEGKQKNYLQKIANRNIKILGWQSDKKIKKYYTNARAFIFAGVDDFGIAPVEAMSHGVPVLAIRKGGILETVEEGKTGEFFNAATPEIIADCVRRFMENEKKYDKRVIIMERAKRFSKDKFIEEFGDYINKIISNN